MQEGIRLHLGCGDVFRPGYVNIDRYDSNVADVIGDITSLPLATASANSIEAFHVIEHFDLIHCKYLLSEWFRVLKRGGKLVLETPDLEETYRAFVKSDSSAQESKLSWIFGIDSPGMLHKVGFTFDLARELLSECGFEDVRRRDPSTHLYEPGMRIECVKPDDSMSADFAALFRRKLTAELGTSDSYILVPLEKYVKKVLSSLRDQVVRAEGNVVVLAAKMTPVNPSISLAVIEAWKESFNPPQEPLNSMQSIVRDLRDRDFHHRILALWVQAKKDGNLEAQFQTTIERLAEDVLRILRGESSLDEVFAYLMSLEPMELPILDFDIVLMDARARLNTGVKTFAAGNLRMAKEALELAAMENPENPLAHWNLARLGAMSGLNPESVHRHYETAASKTLTAGRRRSIEEELASYKASGPNGVPREPVAEY